MADATKTLDIIINAKDNASKEIKGIGDSIKDMAKRAEAGAAAIVGVLGLVVKSAVDGASAYEQQKIALTTLLKDEGKALQTIKDIQKDAIQTPFAFDELVRSNQLLISSGISAKDARKDIMNLANAVAATGGGSDELSRLAINLQQIKNVGEASLLDIKQFGFAGINIFDLLSKSTGKSVAQIKKSKITYEDITKAMGLAADKGGVYENALVNQSKRLQGLTSSIKDVISIGLTSVLVDSGLFDSLVDTLSKVLEFLQESTPKVTEFVKGFLDNKPALYAFLGGLTGLLVPLGIALWGLLAPVLPFIAVAAALGAAVAFVVEKMGGWNEVNKKLTETWNEIVSVYNQYLKPVIDGIVAELSEFAEAILPLFLDAWAAFTQRWTDDLKVAQMIWNAVWPEIKKVFENAWIAISAVFKILWGALQLAITTGLALIAGDFDKAFEGWKKGWADVMEGIKSIARIALDAVVGIFRDKINNMIGLVNGLIDGINKVSGGKSGMAKLPTFQHGGIVPGGFNDAVPAILHGGERVVPRNGVDANGGSSSSVNINITGSFIVDSDSRVNQLAQTVIDMINRQNEIASKGLSV